MSFVGLLCIAYYKQRFVANYRSTWFNL